MRLRQNSQAIWEFHVSLFSLPSGRLVVPFKKFLHVLLLIKHLALAVCKGNQALVAVLLQGVAADFEHLRQFLVRHVVHTVQQWAVVLRRLFVLLQSLADASVKVCEIVLGDDVLSMSCPNMMILF